VKAYTPPPPPCCVGWAGFYLGIHGGYGWKDNDFSEFVGTSVPSNTQVFVGGINSKGWVFGGQEIPVTITSTSVAPNDRFGWVAGVGGEAKLFGSNWIGRIEYLHYEFRTSETVTSQTITGAAGTNFSGRAANQKIEVVRAGISYKF
jgi:opacity protein-like surface antigen